MAISKAAKELTWLKTFLKELGNKHKDFALFSDSYRLAKNPIFHAKTKHTQLRYHFIRQLVDDLCCRLEKYRGQAIYRIY